MKVKRNIVQINEEKCNGCGVCVTPCAEGAIEIVDGKAKVVKEELCDGAGFCLSVCPTEAMTIVEREVEAFDPQAAHQKQQEKGVHYIAQTCFQCGNSEKNAPLLPCRKNGQSLWVCTRCLPVLIHG